MKQRYTERVSVSMQPAFVAIMVMSLILLPVHWVIGWLLAVFFHELGHVTGIVLLKVPIDSVSIECSGTYIRTGQMIPYQELIVAIMGPLFSSLLLLFSGWIPYAAVCALIQLSFNMLPLSGFDGGRILLIVLQTFLPPTWAKRFFNTVQSLFYITIILLGICCNWGVLVLLAIGMLILRTGRATFPCKRLKQIVQWSK